MDHLQLVVSSEDPNVDGTSRLASALIDWIRSELRVVPQIVPADEADAALAVTRDAVTWATLILQIPTSALAFADLASRARAKDRLRLLVAWLRARRGRVAVRTTIGDLELAGDDDRRLDDVLAQLAKDHGVEQRDP